MGVFVVLLIRPFEVPDPFTAGPQWSWTIVCLAAAAAVLLPQLLAGARSSTALRLPLLAYVAACVVTSVTGVDRANSVMWLLALAGNVGVFATAVCVARRVRWMPEAFFCFLLAAITLLLLMATAYHAEVGLLARPKAYPAPEGWSGYPELATLGAVHFALVVAAWQAQKRAAGAAGAALLLALSLAALALLYSRGAWIAVAAIGGVAGLLMLRRGHLTHVLVGLVIILGLTSALVRESPTLRHLLSGGGGATIGGHSIEVATPDMRFQLWTRTRRMIADRPLLGVGPGNFQQVFEVQYNPELNSDGRRGVHAHNDWLQQFAELGVPGGITYLLLWSVVFRLAWTRARREHQFGSVAVLLSLIALAASNVTTNMFFSTGAGSGRLHSLAWLLFGLAAASGPSLGPAATPGSRKK